MISDQNMLRNCSDIIFEYLFAHLNRSSIVVDDFFARDSKNGVPGLMLHLKICKMASTLQDLT